MRVSTVRRAVVELTTLIEGWLETVAYPGEFPHLPPDAAGMMAQQAVGVLEILAAGETALADDGLLGDGDE